MPQQSLKGQVRLVWPLQQSIGPIIQLNWHSMEWLRIALDPSVFHSTVHSQGCTDIRALRLQGVCGSSVLREVSPGCSWGSGGLVPVWMENQRNSWGKQQSLLHLLITGRGDKAQEGLSQLRKGFPSFSGAGCGIKPWLGLPTALSIGHEGVNSHLPPSRKEYRGKIRSDFT